MRKSPRFPVNLEVAFESSDDAAGGIISNLGLKGAFIKTSYGDPAGPFLVLRFPLPDKRSFEALSRVAWQNGAGLGVEFLDLDPNHMGQLWSSLVPLWPSQLSDCPYCHHQLGPGTLKTCPHCHFPLDFQQEGYLERLPDYTQISLEMIGTCPAMLQVFHLIRKVAPADLPVLLTGASGTGKEMVAQAIHERSLRSQGPLVPVNCGAIPRDLLESELFGHEKGSFTGALRTVVGKVELANYGTLFLDEVGELSPELQVKLLRFLHDFTFERVGGRETRRVNLRVISATNADLKELISQGRFRDDLYYRLNGITIPLPDLKDRGDDLLIMATVFLRRYANKTGKKVSCFTKDALKAIQSYHWPGNIRELIHHIRRAVVVGESAWISTKDLGLEAPSRKTSEVNHLGLKEAKARFEAMLVAEALARYEGNVQLAAQALQTTRSVIYHLINKHDLKGYALVSEG
jgi:DNA-binding NtrC family response regulator